MNSVHEFKNKISSYHKSKGKGKKKKILSNKDPEELSNVARPGWP